MRLDKLHKGHLRRHGKSMVHHNAGLESSASPRKRKRIPSEQQFRDVWMELQQGKPPSCGISGIGKAGQIQKKMATLAEGIRWYRRDFIRAIERRGGMSLKRDESKSRLCILFNAVNANIIDRQGLLAWERCVVTDSVTKTEQTRCAFDLFATPFTGCLTPGQFDEAVSTAIREGLGVYVTC